jgi:hypothetical protein
MAKTNYIARLNNEIIGTRSSERTYTHAVVIQYSETFYRLQAESTAHAAFHCSKSNFKYESEIAAGGVEGEMAKWKYMKREEAERHVARASAIVAMGYDAWVEQRRQENIATHAANVAKGGFTPAVVTWCGRPDLAQKEANKRRGETSIANVWIVEAETVEKLPKVKGERKHAAYGPQSD